MNYDDENLYISQKTMKRWSIVTVALMVAGLPVLLFASGVWEYVGMAMVLFGASGTFISISVIASDTLARTNNGVVPSFGTLLRNAFYPSR